MTRQHFPQPGSDTDLQPGSATEPSSDKARGKVIPFRKTYNDDLTTSGSEEMYYISNADMEKNLPTAAPKKVKSNLFCKFSSGLYSQRFS
jgi:hypothetical protein